MHAGGLDALAQRNCMLHSRVGQTDRQTDRQTRFNGNCLCDWHTANGQTKTDNYLPFHFFFILSFICSRFVRLIFLSFVFIFVLIVVLPDDFFPT
jgi:hypothetical protein